VASLKGEDLPQKFWNLPKWSKTFKLQVFAVNSLLKLYSKEAIIAAFNRLKNAYSLNCPILDTILKEEQRKIDIKAELPKEEIIVPVTTNSAPQKPFSPKGNKLKGLD
jgi:hypothetical protein